MDKTAVLHKFGTSSSYIMNNFVIRIRANALRSMLPNAKDLSIIDIACGNAEVSMQFLDEARSLHLVDISESMIRAATDNVEAKYRKKVQAVIYDFEAGANDVECQSYDLVICTGLFAHVRDPGYVLTKLINLVASNGYIFLQNTDSSNIYSKFTNTLQSVANLFRPNSYAHSRLSNSELFKVLTREGFNLRAQYSYISSFPLVGRILTSKLKFRFNKYMFGTPEIPKRQAVANETLVLFQKITN